MCYIFGSKSPKVHGDMLLDKVQVIWQVHKISTYYYLILHTNPHDFGVFVNIFKPTHTIPYFYVLYHIFVCSKSMHLYDILVGESKYPNVNNYGFLFLNLIYVY